MEDRFFAIDTVYAKLGESRSWSLDIKATENGSYKRIAKWIGEGPLTENDLQNMTILWQTLMCSRLNVQLGMDLGLLS